MYGIMKRVIQSGGYKLTKVLEKIDLQWAEGSITDEQRQELRQLAQDGANVSGEVDILERVLNLERRVSAIEAGQAPGADTEEYPPYVEGKWYYTGGKCSENGKNYTCIAPEGTPCVWSPCAYPAYWEEVTDNG